MSQPNEIVGALTIAAVIFLLPLALAWWRAHPHRAAIAALNLVALAALLFPAFLAWGVLALVWGAALVWALLPVKRAARDLTREV